MELWSEMNDVVERELKDEIDLDNLVDVFLCEEMETNNEVATFEKFVKASNDEEKTLTIEEILAELVSDKASNNEEEILTEHLESDKTEASNEKMNDEETKTMGKVMVEEFYSQLNEEILDKEIKRGKEKLKKTRQMRKERDKRWRGEQDKMERAAIKTIATLVPNLRGIKRRTRLQILEDVIHHFKMNNIMNSMMSSDED